MFVKGKTSVVISKLHPGMHFIDDCLPFFVEFEYEIFFYMTYSFVGLELNGCLEFKIEMHEAGG